MAPILTANPYAPSALNTLRANLEGKVALDADMEYTYEVTLTANQLLSAQVVPIDTDSIFCWRGDQVTSNTGAFRIRYADGSGRYLSNGLIQWTAYFVGGVPIVRPRQEIQVAAGGAIQLDIENLTGVNNTVQLSFRGVKRYALPTGESPNARR